MQATFQVLNVLDFTSERARMSIIVRAPNGTIRLHCKGSDSALLALLRPGTDAGTLTQTHTNLHDLSVKACFTPFASLGSCSPSTTHNFEMVAKILPGTYSNSEHVDVTLGGPA